MSAFVTALIALLLALPAQASVNKSITIDAGATSDGASTVNGKVTVGAPSDVAPASIVMLLFTLA